MRGSVRPTEPVTFARPLLRAGHDLHAQDRRARRQRRVARTDALPRPHRPRARERGVRARSRRLPRSRRDWGDVALRARAARRLAALPGLEPVAIVSRAATAVSWATRSRPSSRLSTPAAGRSGCGASSATVPRLARTAGADLVHNLASTGRAGLAARRA